MLQIKLPRSRIALKMLWEPLKDSQQISNIKQLNASIALM